MSTNVHERKIAELKETLRRTEWHAFCRDNPDGTRSVPYHSATRLYQLTEKELRREEERLARYEATLERQRAKGRARAEGAARAARRYRPLPVLPTDEVARVIVDAFNQRDDEEPKASRFVPLTGTELANRPIVQLEYLPLMGRNGWLPKGQTVMFGAPAKAGKSTLLRQWFGELLEWDPSLTIAVVSEEGPEDWQSWVYTLDTDKRARLSILPGAMKSATDIASQVELAYAVWSRHPDLVVMDTLPNILDLPPEAENMARSNALAPWYAIPKRLEWQPTFMGVMHTANGTGRIAGGGGTQGVADVLLTMARVGEAADPTRKLDVVGRRVATQSGRYTMIDEGPILGWTDSRRPSIRERDDTLQAILEDAGELTLTDWRTRYSQETDTNPSDDTFRRWIKTLEVSERDKPGTRGGKPTKVYSPV